MATDWRSGGRLSPEELEQLRNESTGGTIAHRTAIEETWWQREAREKREEARKKRELKARGARR